MSRPKYVLRFPDGFQKNQVQPETFLSLARFVRAAALLCSRTRSCRVSF